MIEHACTTEDERGRGIGTALLRHATDWARTVGYERLSVDWESPSALASRFWRGQGFMPRSYFLCRRVDERISWADGSTKSNFAWTPEAP